ncbi:MAG: hypothetical protein R8G66_15750 [Cytophagales bacterium]|nr:hypothetical protein [Cytophagales bacterium]
MKSSLSTLLLIVIISSSLAQDREAFNNILESYSMTFNMPTGFSETATKENDDLYYYYAIKHDSLNIEIRYTFFFIQDELARELDSGEIAANPNKMYISLTSVNQLNLSGGNEYQVTRFNPEAVQEEFGADDGGTTFFPLNSGFGEGYQYCVMNILHKRRRSRCLYSHSF